MDAETREDQLIFWKISGACEAGWKGLLKKSMDNIEGGPDYRKQTYLMLETPSPLF